MKKLLWIILLIIFISPFTLIPQNLQAQELDEDELYDNPSAREEWRFQMRRDENGIIPFGALNKAKRQLNNIRAKLPKPMDAGISGWEWLGPGNVGGRIRTILIHPTLPNLMWIGSVSGGIWRTDNAGDSWYPVDDFMANLAVTSIVMDPTNSFIMYAATGEGFGNIDGLQGAGIFKSTDVGNTWNQLSSTDNPQFLFVNRLSHHPSLTNILLAATNTGVYRTVDGGNSWAKTLNVVATQVKYLLNNPNNVLCGTASDFYLSTDGGINWQRETTGATNKMPSSPGRCEGDFSSNGNIVYVNMDRNFGEIWRSTDGGLTWQLRNTGSNYFGSPQSQGFYDNAIWVDPTNSNFVVLSGRNLQRSTDGGSNLTKIGGDAGVGVIFGVHPDIHAIIAHPNYNGTTNKTMFIGCDGGIYATQDITTASLTSGWNPLNHDLGITQFYAGSAAPDGSVIAGGAQDNNRQHYKPELGINGWYEGINGGGDGTTTAVDFTNPNIIFMATTGLNIARSDNGGKYYNFKVNGISDNGAWVAPLVMDPNDHNSLLAGGTQIWKTTDGAENWASIRNAITNNPNCSAIDIAKGNSSDLWVGYSNGVVSRSINGGTNWDNVQAVGMPASAVTDIAVNPNNISDVMVTFGGYATGRVWFTDNGGLTWQVRSGSEPNSLPAIQVNTVRFHPLNSDWVYVGTDLGVFASEDKGITWSALPVFASNEGPVNVEVDELFWQGNDKLIAATHGRGMFRTSIQSGIYVDISNPNMGNGTYENPFQKIQDGINAQLNGTPLYIKTGTYQQGPVTFNKRGRIWIVNGPVIIK